MYAHITWHTWNRVACIDARAAGEVRVAVLSAGKRSGVQLIKGEVLANHVHLLVSFRPDTRISDFMRLAKSVSATRANRLVFGAVRWARGYYVTTLHKNDLSRVVQYIERQFERHPDLVPRTPRSSDPGRKPGVTQGEGSPCPGVNQGEGSPCPGVNQGAGSPCLGVTQGAGSPFLCPAPQGFLTPGALKDFLRSQARGQPGRGLAMSGGEPTGYSVRSARELMLGT